MEVNDYFETYATTAQKDIYYKLNDNHCKQNIIYFPLKPTESNSISNTSKFGVRISLRQDLLQHLLFLVYLGIHI